MAMNDWIARKDESFKRLVRQEELILDVTDALTLALDRTGVTKSELARRLGRSPGFVSQVLGGGRNLTLRTISDIAGALSLRPALELRVNRAQAVEVVQETHRSRMRWTPLPRMAASPSSAPPPAASVRYLPHQAAAA